MLRTMLIPLSGLAGILSLGAEASRSYGCPMYETSHRFQLNFPLAMISSNDNCISRITTKMNVK